MIDPNDPFAQLLYLAPLIKEVAEHSMSEPDMLAALSAVVGNPDDLDAREFLDARLAPHRAISKAFKDPFSSRPMMGEANGPFRFAMVDGQEDNKVGLTEEELNHNVIVVGEAGFGKTVTIVNLLVSILEAL